ncbi:hypothetical protein N7466_006923 [Penicillium verhagenii]|uniref:uncharacterized protein n=1 Tax=Penicillium verhagenii TaxID=1562060 RepID=UPI0025458A08|nr:uncharacterized protein N7466_006923 [Penicillium verhagenii]KAJ5927967.1 hypothetical protein N7466_006923 [Penicillium verhagenii]
MGDKRLTVKRDELLNQIRPTVHRIELEEPRQGFPEIVIVKQEKPEWGDEFLQEINAYNRLQHLQGTMIPILFGQGSFNESPALILSEVEGITLRDLAKFDESTVPEKILESELENVFKELYMCGAEHCDLNLGNFLFCNNGKVVVIDLEEVEFPDRRQSWERSVNLGSVGYLMSRFRDVRYPNRPPSPLYWASASGASNDVSGSEELDLPVMSLVSQDLKEPNFVVLERK